MRTLIRPKEEDKRSKGDTYSSSLLLLLLLLLVVVAATGDEQDLGCEVGEKKEISKPRNLLEIIYLCVQGSPRVNCASCECASTNPLALRVLSSNQCQQLPGTLSVNVIFV